MSLEHAVAAPTLVTIAGREFKLAPLTLACFGMVVRHLRENAHDPRPFARRLAATLPPDEARQVLAEAREEYHRATHPTADDAIAFILGGSFEGACWGLWLGFQSHHANEISRDELYRHLLKLKQQPDGQEKTAALIRALVDATGVEAATKNSPPPQAETGENQATPNPPNPSTGTQQLGV